MVYFHRDEAHLGVSVRVSKVPLNHYIRAFVYVHCKCIGKRFGLIALTLGLLFLLSEILLYNLFSSTEQYMSRIVSRSPTYIIRQS